MVVTLNVCRLCQNVTTLRLLCCIVLALLSLFASPAQAHITCRPGDDSVCESRLRPGSKCNEQGICTNPYRSGCLREHLEEFKDVWRTCNSDDDPNDANVMCNHSEFNYPEIRILAQNWETPLLSAWVIQILLSELLNVPTTIETSSTERKANFYDPNNELQYGTVGYDYDALRTAFKVGDCRLTNEPCAHVLPEAWNGQFQLIREIASKEGIIEQPVGSGAVGKLGWFIPRYLAEQDSSLLEYLGIWGRENREKVARTFERPTRWKDYCREVSPFNCAIPNNVTIRRPITKEEGEKFYVPGLYNGHFRMTEDNLYNCSSKLLGDVCTGHITDVPCEWSTFVESQAYYHDINVKSGGNLGANNGYTYEEITQIYFAARETRSPVLLFWWKPEGLYQRFLGEDAELLHVQLRPPRQECVANRPSPEERCSEDYVDRVGDEVGSCDCEAHSLLKLLSSTLAKEATSRVEAERSPAYEAIKSLTLSELQLGDMLDYWYSRGIDEANFDPREATCRWTAENIEFLKLFVPKTFPRRQKQRDWSLVWEFSLFVSCMAALLVVVSTFLVAQYREQPVIRVAQITFLKMVLIGFILSSAGTCIAAVWDPSAWSCTVGNWLLVLGYNLSIVPLIVKIAAINRLHQAAKSCRRLKMSRTRLYWGVGGVLGCAVVYLILRTALDPMTGRTQLDLTTNANDAGETIVEQSLYCDSNTPAWNYFEIGWYCVLLLVASVLAFQSLDVRQEFNETHTLAFMIYSRFVFAILQLMTMFLEESLSPQILFGYRTLIRGVDTTVSLIVYFLPKLYQAMTGKSISSRAAEFSFSRPRLYNFRTSDVIPKSPGGVDRVDGGLNSDQNHTGDESPRSDDLHVPEEHLTTPLKGLTATGYDQECSSDNLSPVEL